jgi:hypothetical protein
MMTKNFPNPCKKATFSFYIRKDTAICQKKREKGVKNDKKFEI